MRSQSPPATSFRKNRTPFPTAESHVVMTATGNPFVLHTGSHPSCPVYHVLLSVHAHVCVAAGYASVAILRRSDRLDMFSCVHILTLLHSISFSKHALIPYPLGVCSTAFIREFVTILPISRKI